MPTAENPSSIPKNKSDQELVLAAQFDVVGRRKEGRPIKLTEARFKRILEHIRRGLTSLKAVRVEGIVYTTWRNHLQRKPEWQKLVDAAEDIREEVWRAEALETIRAAFRTRGRLR
jgi:hypothetical protein